MRRILGNRTVFKGALLVVSVLVALLVLGTIKTSGPSPATIEADRRPTTTTTTEPPPPGVVKVRIDNGIFRPSNLHINLEEIWIVQWINLDDREYIIRASDGAFESEPLGQGEIFEFDYSTLEPALHRYTAFVGFNRIPGSVETRPEQ